MTATMPRAFAVTTALMLLGSSDAVAQSNPCGILTSAESIRHIARGKKTYNEMPEATTIGGGAVCDYPYGGQIGLWNAPNASENFERFLKSFRADKETRHPVSGVGDRAWIMFPVPENQYKDRAAYLVSYVGQKVVTVALFAHDGASDGPMGQVCKGDQKRLKPDERKDCEKILADKSETQESLQPAVIELAKLVVERVRAGK